MMVLAISSSPAGEGWKSQVPSARGMIRPAAQASPPKGALAAAKAPKISTT
jgi:hypothetical protein